MELRCQKNKSASICGCCESCVLGHKLSQASRWFFRAGDFSRRKFLLGLLQHLHSVDILRNIIKLLQPLLCKDYTYARTRIRPSLESDQSTMSSDRALNQEAMQAEFEVLWLWFESASYWTKSNFMLKVMQDCESHLLKVLLVQARTMLTTEMSTHRSENAYEASSLASSVYSFHSEEHPELELLSTAHKEYANIKDNPFNDHDATSSLDTLADYDEEIVNSDIEECSEAAYVHPLDPTIMVVPGSPKAYAGVARHKDFIHGLPVHLSKLILGFLDRVSLYNCLCVSSHWRAMAEEVQAEQQVSQRVKEEVVLMEGAAASGSNPVYARDIDVAVPNISLQGWEAIQIDDDHDMDTAMTGLYGTGNAFLKSAYTGYSTRNIIMEERNVYCGAYNVMVLKDEMDLTRVVSTDGSRLVAMGNQSNKVRLINNETAQEENPCISGHAGSVRCLDLCVDRGFVVSGSYDTSIRKWSLETGKCQRIFRGHRDTVTCLKVHNDKVVSGGKDCMCKVWWLDDAKPRKCFRTFKHRYPITAVALGEDPLPEVCITGCEAGRVKVWDMKTGKVIKRLTGHQGPITAIKFDSWHIITGSRDGYALLWSARGDYSRCLTALRHPKGVLCLEFLYLRAITGSEDGKIRIWNMLTGQCLRIIRGNSRSDPVLDIIARGNMLTINTTRNLLVFNFEPVEYDYFNSEEKLPPMVHYSVFAEVPAREHPYSYIRAQRMKSAGASNKRILKRDCSTTEGQSTQRPYTSPQQISHSAKGLSQQSIRKAIRAQSASGRLKTEGSFSRLTTSQHTGPKPHTPENTKLGEMEMPNQSASAKLGMPSYTKHPSSGAGVRSAKHAMDNPALDIPKPNVDYSDSEVSLSQAADSRRYSWAFDYPEIVSKAKEPSLCETKSLMRSQIRSRNHIEPPGFITTAVENIQATKKPSVPVKDMDAHRKVGDAQMRKKLGRPFSSPGRVDPRTKVHLEDLGLEPDWWVYNGQEGKEPDRRSVMSDESLATKQRQAQLDKTVIITQFSPQSMKTQSHHSLHSGKLISSIPKPRILRPRTATVASSKSIHALQDEQLKKRPKSAVVSHTEAQTQSTATPINSRPGTAKSTAATAVQKHRYHGFSTASTDISQTPMLMYCGDMRDKMTAMLSQKKEEEAKERAMDVASQKGKVSTYNHPLRTHADFRLLSHDQVNKQMRQIESQYREKAVQEEEQCEKTKRRAWLTHVKNRNAQNVKLAA